MLRSEDLQLACGNRSHQVKRDIRGRGISGRQRKISRLDVIHHQMGVFVCGIVEIPPGVPCDLKKKFLIPFGGQQFLSPGFVEYTPGKPFQIILHAFKSNLGMSPKSDLIKPDLSRHVSVVRQNIQGKRTQLIKIHAPKVRHRQNNFIPAFLLKTCACNVLHHGLPRPVV